MSEEQQPEQDPNLNKDNAENTPEETPNKANREFTDDELAPLNIGLHAKNFGTSIWEFIKDLMNIREDTDYVGSQKRIKSGIDFKGFNVWILICSIIIASIGLNVNSIPVVVGAMLISPLMGPILGVGLAVGTNDLKTLVRSVKSFGTAVAVSLLTSYIYFLITPLSETTTELLGRTEPTILDVLVAAFGGLAGIIATSRKDPTNVIPGVAIATALMPPLCTAGYGLASGNLTYFAGALYLFLLNSLFICITTFIVIRYLGFPLKQHLDKKREGLVKRYIWIFTILIIVPSTWLFITVILESRFKIDAESFVTQEIAEDNKNIRVTDKNYHYSDTAKVIEVFLAGEYVSDEKQSEWRKDLKTYGLEDCRLNIFQSSINPELFQNDAANSNELVNTMMASQESLKGEKADLEKKLAILQKELRRMKDREIPFEKVSTSMRTGFKEVEDFSYGYTMHKNINGHTDSIFTFMVKWKPNLDTATINARKADLDDLFTGLFEVDTLRILPY